MRAYHVVRTKLAPVRQVVRGVDFGGPEATEVEGADLIADEHGGRAVDESLNGDRVHGEDVEGVIGHGDVKRDRDVERGHAENLADGGEPDNSVEVGAEEQEYLLDDLGRHILYAPHFGARRRGLLLHDGVHLFKF